MFPVVLVSGVLVVVALSRAGSALFWRTGDAPGVGVRTTGLQAGAAGLLLSGAVALMVGAGAATAYTQATAAQLADRIGHIDAVLSNQNLVPSPSEGSQKSTLPLRDKVNSQQERSSGGEGWDEGA